MTSFVAIVVESFVGKYRVRAEESCADVGFVHKVLFTKSSLVQSTDSKLLRGASWP